MEKFILDTNLFFNMEPGLGLSNKTEELIKIVTDKIKTAKAQKKAEFFMPPRVIEEFLGFFEDKNQGFLKDFLSVVTSKSPDVNSIQFPAAVFYKLVKDIRERSYRGLTIAEEVAQKAVQEANTKPVTNKKDLQLTAGPLIKNLRERYRQATRVGFLDSLADLDLIALTREIGGTLVSSDEGVVLWGRTFGVKEMAPHSFGRYLSRV